MNTKENGVKIFRFASINQLFRTLESFHNFLALLLVCYTVFLSSNLCWQSGVLITVRIGYHSVGGNRVPGVVGKDLTLGGVNRNRPSKYLEKVLHDPSCLEYRGNICLTETVDFPSATDGIPRLSQHLFVIPRGPGPHITCKLAHCHLGGTRLLVAWVCARFFVFSSKRMSSLDPRWLCF